MELPQKIAVFGGTFNPINKGHIKIAKLAIKKLGLDSLYFVPNYQNPFKNKQQSYVSGEHRYNMIKLVLPEKAKVCEFEINKKGISYTIDTIKFFKHRFKNAQLYFIIGSDNLEKLHKWKDIDLICQLSQIIVFKRDKKINKKNLKKYNAVLFDNKIYDFSSTNIRHSDFSGLFPAVHKYISSNFLYIEDLLKFHINNGERLKHCYATAQLAAEYAKQLKKDAKIAYYGGLLHDITKTWSKEKHREFLAQCDVDQSKVPDYKLHQLSAYFWLTKKYKIAKKTIANSIASHTSLAYDMDDYAKIVYMADKLARGRKYPGVQKLRELAKKDFYQGFKSVLEANLKLLQSEGKIDEEQQQIYKFWINS